MYSSLFHVQETHSYSNVMHMCKKFFSTFKLKKVTMNFLRIHIVGTKLHLPKLFFANYEFLAYYTAKSAHRLVLDAKYLGSSYRLLFIFRKFRISYHLECAYQNSFYEFPEKKMHYTCLISEN